MFIKYFLYNFSSLIINKKTNKYAEATSKHMKKKNTITITGASVASITKINTLLENWKQG